MAVGLSSLHRANKEKKSKTHGDELPIISILGPIKNEERVVGRFLDALLKLNYPVGKKEIILVEDGSTDATVEICREYVRMNPGQVKLLHKPFSNGKPSALNYALREARGEVIAVFDADNIPELNTLSKAADYFRDPNVAAVQGTMLSINADENRLTKLISYEEIVRFGVYIRGKDALNLFVPLTGSCCFIRRSVLDKIHGWNDEFLSEDMELSARLSKEDCRIKYAPDIVSWQENPSTVNQLFGQRIRWLRGCMEVALKYGKLMSKPCKRNIDAELTLVGPYMFAPCLLSYIITILAFLMPVPSNYLSMFMAQATSLLTITLLSIIGIALVFSTKPRKPRNILWVPFIYAYWSLQTFLAMFALIQIVLKRPRKWTRTAKTGTVSSTR